MQIVTMRQALDEIFSGDFEILSTDFEVSAATDAASRGFTDEYLPEVFPVRTVFPLDDDAL